MSYLKLDNVALLGRTFEEYEKFFMLADACLNGGKVLDMAGGVSSFCAEATLKGLNVIAADPIYSMEPFELERQCESDLDDVMNRLPEIAHNYRWHYYRGVEHLREHRTKAYTGFLADYARRHDHYVHATLPFSGFQEDEFLVSLVSHLLFLYDELFDYQFHKAGILELARITSKEVRIYPIANLRGWKSPFVDMLLHDPDCGELDFEIRITGFEFLKNAGELLIVRKKKAGL